jgi:hypothetical protein
MTSPRASNGKNRAPLIFKSVHALAEPVTPREPRISATRGDSYHISSRADRFAVRALPIVREIRAARIGESLAAIDVSREHGRRTVGANDGGAGRHDDGGRGRGAVADAPCKREHCHHKPKPTHPDLLHPVPWPKHARTPRVCPARRRAKNRSKNQYQLGTDSHSKLLIERRVVAILDSRGDLSERGQSRHHASSHHQRTLPKHRRRS